MKKPPKVKIYTRTGDRGETSLYGGKRISKDHLRVETYGTIDELNAALGTAHSFITDTKIRTIIEKIQNELFNIGAELSTPTKVGKDTKQKFSIGKEKIQYLENVIDQLDEKLPLLRNFILPGGSNASSLLQLSRSIARRAERRLITLSRKEEINENLLSYINRLSDFLFVLARYLNKKTNGNETIWKKE
ncbi:MAG: cob(I)yrinic acid a,c-diamide adenosyltransferase [Candidatus Woykebacteria bacterium]